MPFATGTLTRFRVRLAGREFALPHGTTVVGRDSSCLIAIGDPLMSRQHARIQCDGEHATIEDLQSRNGTRVNGIRITGPHSLRDGDRVSVGGSEFSFTRVDEVKPADAVATGVVFLCAKCASVGPQPVCEVCGGARGPREGHQVRTDETAQGRWSLGMLVEMLGRAMLSGRTADVERLMHEVATLVLDQPASPLDPEEVKTLDAAARWLSKAKPNGNWLGWIQALQLRGITSERPPPNAGPLA